MSRDKCLNAIHSSKGNFDQLLLEQEKELIGYTDIADVTMTDHELKFLARLDSVSSDNVDIKDDFFKPSLLLNKLVNKEDVNATVGDLKLANSIYQKFGYSNLFSDSKFDDSDLVAINSCINFLNTQLNGLLRISVEKETVSVDMNITPENLTKASLEVLELFSEKNLKIKIKSLFSEYLIVNQYQTKLLNDFLGSYSKKIDEMDLTKTRMTPLIQGYIGQCPNLTVLSLGDASIEEIKSWNLPLLESLKVENLNAPPQEQEGITAVLDLDKLKNLQHLDIHCAYYEGQAIFIEIKNGESLTDCVLRLGRQQLEMDALPRLKTLDISMSGLLTVPPVLLTPSLENLTLHDPQLQTPPFLDGLSELRTLNMDDCISLTQRPVVSENVVVSLQNCPNLPTEAKLVVDQEEIYSDPEKVLRTAVKELHGARSFKVRFKNQPAVDAFGVTRQFIGELFEQLSSKLGFNQKTLPQWSEEKKSTFEAMGYLLGFLLKQSEKVKIGEVFPSSFFELLVNMNHEEICHTLNEMPPSRQFRLHAMDIWHTANPKTKGIMESMQFILDWDCHKIAANSEEGRGLVRDVVEVCNVYDLSPPSSLKTLAQALKDQDSSENIDLEQYVDQIKIDHNLLESELNELKEACCEEFNKGLHAVHSIAKGFEYDFNQWQKLQTEGSDKLQADLQGAFDKERLKKCFNYGARIPGCTRNFVERWIDQRDDKTVKLFLRYATGSTVLPENKIKFRISETVSIPEAQSCFELIEFPGNFFKVEGGPKELEERVFAFLDGCCDEIATYEKK